MKTLLLASEELNWKVQPLSLKALSSPRSCWTTDMALLTVMTKMLSYIRSPRCFWLNLHTWSTVCTSYIHFPSHHQWSSGWVRRREIEDRPSKGCPFNARVLGHCATGKAKVTRLVERHYDRWPGRLSPSSFNKIDQSSRLTSTSSFNEIDRSSVLIKTSAFYFLKIHWSTKGEQGSRPGSLAEFQRRF